MVIVESKEEFSNFLSYWNGQTSMSIPIWVDPFLRPKATKLSFLYVRFLNEDFILPLDHNDCSKFDFDLNQLGQSVQRKIIWDKKGFLQSELGGIITNLTDLQAQSFFLHNQLISFDDSLQNLTSFWTRQGSDRNLGKIIPIVKWISVLQEITKSLPFQIQTLWVDDKIIPILAQIEEKSLPVDRKKFLDKWPSLEHLISQKDGRDVVYTEYNPYTMTSRPTNRHGGINWGALNKEDGTRQVIQAGEGREFFMLDYDAYHLRLIGKLLKIDLPNTSIHQMFADQWGIDYNEAKSRTFRILYGGVREEDKKIAFFKIVDNVLKVRGYEWERRGYMQTPAGRIIKNSWIQDWTPIKGFNYLLQATETEFNIQTLWKLVEEKLPLPIMYNYDSFMWELPAGDTTTAHKLRQIIELPNIPAKGSWGKTYDEL